MSWLDRFRSPEKVRERLFKQAPDGPMREYLSVPFVDGKTPLQECPIVALDFETTGLDPAKDEIVSLGLVEMHDNTVKLSTAWHQLVRIDREMPQESVVIHTITDDLMQQGQPIEEVLPELLKRLRGKVMLAHYKRIEQNFIDAACRRLYGIPFLIPTIDTLELGQRVLERKNHTVQVNDLRLFNLRPTYNLPAYKAHNALTDALSTAELLLALGSEISPRGTAQLKDVLSR